MRKSYGEKLREELATGKTLPFIGCYDVFSAALAGQYYDSIFISGFGFAASHYGLPDIGFIAWSDIVDFVRRVRALLPHHHILVDIDDGYVDIDVAKHVTHLLYEAGASGIILEDQQRPRRCGHYDGKQLLPIEDYMEKLNSVLKVHPDLFVVARTDASDMADIRNRLSHFFQTKADAILVDGISNVGEIVKSLNVTNRYYVYNQIFGGKSKTLTTTELNKMGISIAIYSTPCLFAAQSAITHAMESLVKSEGNLETIKMTVNLKECSDALQHNLKNSLQANV
jgi:2-methylisocitrate lyase-like PEP mutase family enzyme